MSDDSDPSSQLAPVTPEPAPRSLREVLRAKLAEPSRKPAASSSIPPAREEVVSRDASPDASQAPRPSGLAERLAAALAASPRENDLAADGVKQEAPFSVLRFDASHPEVRALAVTRGWEGPDRKVGILQAELTFTTDGWTTTRHAPLQALAFGGWGFRLEGVLPGTELEFAIHAELGLSATGAPPFDAQLDTWLNNGGANHRTPAEEP
jgi:hypothetical protein